MGTVDPHEPSADGERSSGSNPTREPARLDVAVAKAISYLESPPRAVASDSDSTVEWISDAGVSRAPKDPRRAAKPILPERGVSLYHATILSRAHDIDMNGFDDDMDASVSLWYTEGGDIGPLFEDRLPLLPEGLPAELRGAFVEIRVPDLDALADYIAHPEHDIASVGQSARYIIPTAVANTFPRRVVTEGVRSNGAGKPRPNR
jgi:hypothetical protein